MFNLFLFTFFKSFHLLIYKQGLLTMKIKKNFNLIKNKFTKRITDIHINVWYK
jgi:hypothetical protein